MLIAYVAFLLDILQLVNFQLLKNERHHGVKRIRQFESDQIKGVSQKDGKAGKTGKLEIGLGLGLELVIP